MKFDITPEEAAKRISTEIADYNAGLRELERGIDSKTDDVTKNLLFDTYIYLFLKFTGEWKLDQAEIYLKRAQELAKKLGYADTHPLVQELKANESYYLLLKTWTGDTEAEQRLRNMLTFEFLDYLSRRSSKNFWLMDTDLLLQLNWRDNEFIISDRLVEESFHSPVNFKKRYM